MELAVRELPERFSTGNGKTYERAGLKADVYVMGRDDIKAVAKFLHGYWNAVEINRTWLGQAATKEQFIEFITTGYIKTAVTVREEPVMPTVSLEPSRNGSHGSSNGSNGASKVPSHDSLADILAEALQGRIKAEASVSAEQVNALMEERLEEFAEGMQTLFQGKFEALAAEIAAAVPKRTELIVTLPNGTQNVVRGQHKLFKKLLHRISLRRNTYLVGPAGSGKSEAAKEAAKALGLAYEDISVCQQTMAHAFLGYHDAGGKYIETPFYRMYKNGGVFNCDELDKGNANTIALLNSGASGKGMTFPVGWVDKHADFVFVATANTIGEGSSRIYVGSTQLDGATTDRYAFMEWGYDEQFETELVVSRFGEERRGWVERVQRYRANVSRCKGLQVIISPRASLYGAEDIASGLFTVEECEDAYIFKGRDEATCNKIRGTYV
jgi:hypothetical protein